VPVDERLATLAHDARYLGEHVRAENMQGIADGSMDGITLNFVLHHIDAKNHAAVFAELRRVLKPDGNLFVAEDLADSEQEAKIVEAADRRINMEIAAEATHNYRSRQEWHEFFRQHGFEVAEDHETKPGKVRHGFFVLKRLETRH